MFEELGTYHVTPTEMVDDRFPHLEENFAVGKIENEIPGAPVDIVVDQIV